MMKSKVKDIHLSILLNVMIFLNQNRMCMFFLILNMFCIPISKLGIYQQLE